MSTLDETVKNRLQHEDPEELWQAELEEQAAQKAEQERIRHEELQEVVQQSGKQCHHEGQEHGRQQEQAQKEPPRISREYANELQELKQTLLLYSQEQVIGLHLGQDKDQSQTKVFHKETSAPQVQLQVGFQNGLQHEEHGLGEELKCLLDQSCW